MSFCVIVYHIIRIYIYSSNGFRSAGFASRTFQVLSYYIYILLQYSYCIILYTGQTAPILYIFVPRGALGSTHGTGQYQRIHTIFILYYVILYYIILYYIISYRTWVLVPCLELNARQCMRASACIAATRKQARECGAIGAIRSWRLYVATKIHASLF